MATFYLIFFIIAVPIVFFMLTWTLVTAGRLLFPETPKPLVRDPVVVRRKATDEGVFVPVGVREIREDQRHDRQAHPAPPYLYAFGASDGLPEPWREDLWRRRN